MTDYAFSILYPQATSYAEQRIYHDIPFLAQRLQDTSLKTTAGQRSISLFGTTLPIVYPQRLALTVLPLYLQDGYGNNVLDGYGNPIIVSGVPPYQVPFLPTSLDFIDLYWPTESQTWGPGASLGNYWCIEGGFSPSDFTSPTIVIAPTPDAAYPITVTGMFREIPLSAGNPQTYLSTNYPELMLCASMVFLSGALLRNYSSQGGTTPDEAGMPISWEGQYMRLKDIAAAEELRRRSQGTDFLDRPPMAASGPPRR